MRTGELTEYGLMIEDDGSEIRCSESGYSYKKQTSNGYKYIQVMRNKKRHTLLIHRLVALVFIPNPDNLPDVNHIDGNKANNHWQNLEWISHAGNILHAMKTGLMNQTGRPSLAERDSEIRSLFREGSPITEISEKFKVSKERVKQIIKGRNTNAKYVKSANKYHAGEIYERRRSVNAFSDTPSAYG